MKGRTARARLAVVVVQGGVLNVGGGARATHGPLCDVGPMLERIGGGPSRAAGYFGTDLALAR